MSVVVVPASLAAMKCSVRLTTFLSRVTADSTSARRSVATEGTGPSRSSSVVTRAASAGGVTPRATPRARATRMPSATASPWRRRP